MKEPQYDALLLYGSSEEDSNLFYATQFFVPDPFFFIQKNGKKYVLLSDLELDRGKKQAKVNRVLSYTQYQRKAEKRLNRSVAPMDVLQEVLQQLRIKTLAVPSTFPLGVANLLREKKFKIYIKKDPFFPTASRQIRIRSKRDHPNSSIC